MIIYHKIYVLIISLLLMACGGIISDNRPSKDNSLIKKEHYANGNVLSEGQYKNDSIRDGYFKQFYSNGNVEIERYYKNDKKEGIEKAYYESGKLKYIGFNKNGEADSVTTWFYENGEPKGNYSYFNGKPFGNQYEYYDSGVCSKYFFYNLDGSILYKVEYDSHGKEINSVGNPLYLVYNKNELSKDEKIEIISYMAIPPNCSYTFSVEESSLNDKIKIPRKEIKKINNLYYSISNYQEYKFNKVGDHKLNFILEIKDTLTNKTSHYSNLVNVNVK